MSFPIGSDVYVKLSDIVRNDTAAALTSGTSCTCRLLTSQGATITGADAITMTHVESTAVWSGTLPASDTVLMTWGKDYIVRVTYTDDSGWIRIIDKIDIANYQ